MPTYVYKARDAAGKPVKGTIASGGRKEVVDKLRKMGYMTTYVAEARAGLKAETLFEGFRKVSSEDMILFYAQFSNMLGSGISILTVLKTLERQIENKKLNEAVGSAARGVEGGATLSEALSAYPAVFPRLFVDMVKAGEASGKLDSVLAKFAEFSEREEDLKQKIKGALFYPLILLCAGIAVTLFIITFIIPQFSEIFAKAGISLPAPTRFLYVIGMAIKHFWYSFILFGLVIWLATTYYAGTKSGKLKMDRLKLWLPVFGSLHRKSAISRFARTLGTLVAGGVPILRSLDVARDVAQNEVLARVIANARKAVERGENISETLKISGEFPADVTQMIFAGEESGRLEVMLNKISDFYDMAAGYTIKKLTAVIEPIFLLIMGGMVGFIMASMLLPIFDMINILRH